MTNAVTADESMELGAAQVAAPQKRSKFGPKMVFVVGGGLSLLIAAGMVITSQSKPHVPPAPPQNSFPKVTPALDQAEPGIPFDHQSDASLPAPPAAVPVAGPQEGPAQQGLAGVAQKVNESVQGAVDSVASSITQLGTRVDVLTDRVTTLETRMDKVETRVSALEQHQASAPVASNQHRSNAMFAITPNPRTVFDRFEMSKSGETVEARLAYDPAYKSPKFAVQRSKDGKWLIVDVSMSVITVLPPQGEGFIKTVKTGLHPKFRRFYFESDEAFSDNVTVKDGYLSVAMTPGGFTPSVASNGRGRKATVIEMPARPAVADSAYPVTGVGIPDGAGITDEAVAGKPTPVTGSALAAPATPASAVPEVPPLNGKVVPRYSQAYGTGLAAPAVVPTEIAPEQSLSPLRKVTEWKVSAMTDDIALLVNNQTGEPMPVRAGTLIPGIGRVKTLKASDRIVVTDAGDITQ